MKKLIFLLTIFIFSFSFISAASMEVSKEPGINIYYFYQIGCSHCANVDASGILDKIQQKYNLERLEIRANETSRDKFNCLADKLSIPSEQRGTPLLIIEKNNEFSYLIGDEPIINDLENSIINFKPQQENSLNCNNNDQTNPPVIPPVTTKITLWSIIIAALIDSINPCAFGVLVFLMLSLLKMGSAKRALRAGLVYTLSVFVVYFLSGFGIFKVIQSLSSISYIIYLLAGILVFIAGLIELKDFFWYGKGISLKIPTSTKPMIEKWIHKGTIPAMIILGILVSLFELPCTGGVYLAILTIMSKTGFAWGYLLLYNLIFILPLIVITLIIYKGTSPEVISNWTESNKRLMRLAGGLIMLALGIYILWPYIF